MNKINLLISLVFLSTALNSCAPNMATHPQHGAVSRNFMGDSTDSNAMLSINSLLILPVSFDNDVRIQSRNAGLFYDALVNAFRSDVDMDLKYDESFLGDFQGNSPGFCLAYARARGPAYGSDAVLCTTLHRFNELKGSSLGTESPASLSFSVEIFRISDGRSVWSGDFVFKDSALNENLFALQQHLSERGPGAGWQSARTMLERGFHEASGDFARRRLSKFAPGQF